jgi:methylphosphotriester-DNA--protein-cysteine methyltransferase
MLVGVSYAVLAPHPALAPFVESLWIQDEPALEEEVEPTTLLPAGRAALVLEFGDPFEEVRPDGARRRHGPLQLCAQRTEPARVAACGRTGLVIVNFRPFGAAAFLGPQGEHAGALVDARALVSDREAREVLDELLHARDDRARAAAVERFLLARRPRGGPDGPHGPGALVAAAVERIERAAGREPIEDLCAALGTGRRQLARAFERGVGLGPKALARIVRFQHALRRARAGASWAAVAASAGYHDQAHLAKECVALTGRAPGALLPRVEERALGRTFNDTDARLARFATYL